VFGVRSGFACVGCASFKPFWPLALVQQAQAAIVFVVRGLCGHFRFCALGLTRRSSRPAYCGRLILFVSQSTGENVFRILLIALLAFGVWKGYEKYQSQRPAQQFQEIDISSGSSRRNRSIDLTPKFQCDGRTHCSQMTSCEEATFFLKNCPGTKMDGNNDGVPCEQQWCK
jgi:hypothetical protein